MTRQVTIIATHVAPAKGYGGVVEFTANLARAWGRQGRSFLICASDASRQGRVTAVEAATELGTEVQLYHAFWLKRWGFGPGALWQVPRAIRRAKTVYVCGVATWPVTIGALVAWLLGRPYVVSPHGGLMAVLINEIRREPHKWLYYTLLTLPALRRARAIGVTSEVERSSVRALLPNATTILVPNGVDLERWSKAPPPAITSGYTFCFVGRISREKGINRFVRTWLGVRHPDDRLIIAGDGQGAYADELRRAIAGSGGAVELLGYLDQTAVHEALARSHFLVLPSERENFGNVVAEALAVGRPVLVSHGLAWDFIGDAGMGFTFDRTEASVAAVFNRIRSITPEEYTTMCHNARSFAEMHLDLNQTSRRLWEIVAGCERSAQISLAAQNHH